MAKEYIIRETAIVRATKVLADDFDAYDVKAALEAIPSEDVVPVRHGRLLGTEFGRYDSDGNPVFFEWICSECRCVFEGEEPKMNYCPNCGTRWDL